MRDLRRKMLVLFFVFQIVILLCIYYSKDHQTLELYWLENADTFIDYFPVEGLSFNFTNAVHNYYMLDRRSGI